MTDRQTELDLADSCAERAGVLQNQGRHDQAEPLYRRALSIYERVLGADLDRGVATTMNNLAFLLKAEERLDEAESLFRRAVGVYERCNGVNHAQTATGYDNLAWTLQVGDTPV